MTPEEQIESNARRAEGEARYHEARFGKLPNGTYRLLEQGGIAGWHLELEIDVEEIVLAEPDGDHRSMFAVYRDRKRAVELARAEITRRHGQAAGEAAVFNVVWGGCL